MRRLRVVLMLALLPLWGDAGAARQAASLSGRSARNASYTLAATLDPAARTVTGSGRLTWRNVSNVPASELRFHLYWNAWRNDHSSFLRAGARWSGDLAEVRDDAWARIDVTAAAMVEPEAADLLASAEYVAPDDGNEHDRTVLRLRLPRAIAPGETATIDLQWDAIVPRTFARTGRRGDYFFVAQWFPKVGVLEPDGAWSCHQFVQTEFYADYGSYDVTLPVEIYPRRGCVITCWKRIHHFNSIRKLLLTELQVLLNALRLWIVAALVGIRSQ